jgi:sugar phosphate isomerase/epimerase
MAIELGTVAAIGFDDFPPAEWLGCLRQLGCTAVQAYRNPSAGVTVEQMKDAIAAGGMRCDSLHGIFGEEYDPSSPDNDARRFAVDTYKAEGELALQLGGPLVVVHCSTIRREGVSPDEYARRFEQLRRSILDLSEFGAANGVQYAFENLPGYHAIGSNVAELAGLLADLAAPQTGMCFDAGHANMVGDPVEAVRTTRGQLIYVHYSDNSGEGDDHEMPTYGTIDSDAMAAALHETGYAGTMMIEVFYPVEKFQRLIDDGCADRLARLLAIANGQPAS